MEPEAHEKIYKGVSLDDLETVAQELIHHAGRLNTWLFYGDIGAGKTTLIRALGKALGVIDSVSSPTFALVNEYWTSGHKKIFHFDFYRIKTEREARDIGAEEYFYSDQYCFVEWPEKIPGILPDDRVNVTITLDDNTHRTIAISIHAGQEKIRI